MRDLSFLVTLLGATAFGVGLVYALRTRSFLGWWFVGMAIALVLFGLQLEPVAAVLLALGSLTLLGWLLWRFRRRPT